MATKRPDRRFQGAHRPDPYDTKRIPDRKVCPKCGLSRSRYLFDYDVRSKDMLSKVCTVCRPVKGNISY